MMALVDRDVGPVDTNAAKASNLQLHGFGCVGTSLSKPALLLPDDLPDPSGRINLGHLKVNYPPEPV